MRAAIKSAAINEKPVVVKQFAEILVKLEQTKKIDEIIDMIENREEGSSGMFGNMFPSHDLLGRVIGNLLNVRTF